MKYFIRNQRVYDMANLELLIKKRQSKQMMKPITLLLNELRKMQNNQTTFDLNKQKWMTEKEAAVYLSIGNSNMFREWRENLGLPFYIPSGKKILYKRIDLDAFVEKTLCQIPIRK